MNLKNNLYEETKNLLEKEVLEESKITLDDIAEKASELGFEVMDDDRDDEGLTLLIYPPDVDEDEYDDFYDYDVEEIFEYLDSIPAVRYQTDDDDPHSLAVWLKEI